MTVEIMEALRRIEDKMEAHGKDTAVLIERVENLRNDFSEANAAAKAVAERVSSLEHFRTGLMARVSVVVVALTALGSAILSFAKQALALVWSH